MALNDSTHTSKYTKNISTLQIKLIKLKDTPCILRNHYTHQLTTDIKPIRVKAHKLSTINRAL